MDAIATARRQDFEDHYTEYLKQLFRYVLKLTRNEAEAEEIAQTAALQYWASMEKRQWRDEVKNVRACLRMIARNIYLDARRNPREQGLGLNDEEQTEQVREALQRNSMQNNDPTARLESKIYYEELYKSLPLQIFLGSLSGYELRLLYMDAVEEMSSKEIGQVIGEDADRVRMQLNRIHAKIRFRYRNFYPDPALRESAVRRQSASSKTGGERFDSPVSSLASAVRECVHAVQQAHEQIQRNRGEIDRLRGETRRLLSELKAI